MDWPYTGSSRLKRSTDVTCFLHSVCVAVNERKRAKTRSLNCLCDVTTCLWLLFTSVQLTGVDADTSILALLQLPAPASVGFLSDNLGCQYDWSTDIRLEVCEVWRIDLHKNNIHIKSVARRSVEHASKAHTLDR